MFDFDGTVTSKDTFLELIKFINGRKKFLAGMTMFFPLLVLYKAKLVSGQTMKEKVMTYFWKDMDEAAFAKCCNDFALQRLPALLRKSAIREIEEHLAQKHTISLVSASGEDWVKPFCDQYSINCIASILEKKNGKLTGKIAGYNCNGKEKVNRIKKMFNLSSFQAVIAYGDTSGDKPMFSIASRSFFKPFRN